MKQFIVRTFYTVHTCAKYRTTRLCCLVIGAQSQDEVVCAFKEQLVLQGHWTWVPLLGRGVLMLT